MLKLIDELDNGYRFAYENVDTTTPEGIKSYQIMANCIEQYRREMYQIFAQKNHIDTISKETIDKLGM